MPRFKKSHLMIHHSLTKDGETVSWNAIRRYHVETNGWDDIGYHLGVEMVGKHYEMLVGRPLRSKAAAAYQYNMNEVAIHVCFIGNYDEAPPDEAMLQFAAPHLTHVCELAGVAIDKHQIIGHRDVYSAKSCPGTMFAIGRLIALMQAV